MPPRIDDEVIETTAGEVAAELARRGIDPTRHVTVRLEPEDRFLRACRAARAAVEADGLTDNEIDDLIEEARHEANEIMRGKARP